MSSEVQAQAAVSFGEWRAFCAPTAGCALGADGKEGDKLAFSEPLQGEPMLLFVPQVSVARGTTVIVTLDGYPGATLGPGDGWRVVETSQGPAVQLSPSIARNELMPRMLKRDMFEVAYVTESGVRRQVAIPLNGYSDARGYADGG